MLRLRWELLQVDWDEQAGLFRVHDTEGRLLMIIGTSGPVHSAVVFSALAALKRWQPAMPRDGHGHTTWRPEHQPAGGSIHAVMANDWPLAIGLGPSEAAAFKDLARIRVAVGL